MINFFINYTMIKMLKDYGSNCQTMKVLKKTQENLYNFGFVIC